MRNLQLSLQFKSKHKFIVSRLKSWNFCTFWIRFKVPVIHAIFFFLTHTRPVNHDSKKFTTLVPWTLFVHLLAGNYAARLFLEKVKRSFQRGYPGVSFNQLPHSPFKLRKLQIAKFFYLYYLLTTLPQSGLHF